jgi:ABC-2 type transport system permease protein
MTTTTLAPPVPATPQPVHLTPRPTALGMRPALAMLGHQLRFELKASLRNRQARFFTLGLPVLMLVLFSAIFGHMNFGLGHARLSGTTYYLANQIGFGTVDAAFMTLAVSLVMSRESGVFKRRRATAQPAWVVVAGRALVGASTALALIALLLLIARVAYSASVPLRTVPGLVLASLVGTVAFGSLGFAAASLVRTAEAAQPTVMALALPLFFISGVFVPWALVPHWLQAVANVFPVRHLANAVLASLASSGRTVNLGDLAVVGLWGAGGLLVAVRRFSWAPRGG